MKHEIVKPFILALRLWKRKKYQCTEDEVLQECDVNGENCEAVENCMEQGLMCHAEMGYCMAMEDSGSM